MRTKACEPMLGVKTHCKVLVLSKHRVFKWFVRFVNICLFLCSRFLCFLFYLRLYSSFGLLFKATLIASRVRE